MAKVRQHKKTKAIKTTKIRIRTGYSKTHAHKTYINIVHLKYMRIRVCAFTPYYTT